MEQAVITIQVILGSTRKGRYSEKPGHWIVQELQQYKNVKAELVDLRDYPLPFYDQEISPMKLNGKYEDLNVAKWSDKIKQGDAYIIITPEYNHGYTAVLKNALDHLYPEWNYKPVGFLSYGSVGGARVIEQTRLVAIELQMIPIKNAIHIPMEVYMATMNENQQNTHAVLNAFLRKANRDFAGAFLDELITMVRKIGNK